MNITQPAGILSDNQIRELCTPPAFMVARLQMPTWPYRAGDGLVVGMFEPYWGTMESIEANLRKPNPQPGDIAKFEIYHPTKHGEFKPMIEPFHPNQNRMRERAPTIAELNMFNLLRHQGASHETIVRRLQELTPTITDVAPGFGTGSDRLGGTTILEKIISQGTSSYGYDITCGREFKIFTNVNSSIVDPKNFDPKSFVDVVATAEKPYVIIPPNSFALARTNEYFRIPRNVLTVCLGKSTYARCFTGDTKVALVDGTSVTFEDMVKRSEQGEQFWGYGVSQLGTIDVVELTAPRKVGTEKVIEVMLDNGKSIRCTPDHKFMTRTGEYVEAKDLKPEDSLMPLYRGEYRGYESVYQPAMGRMVSTHWLADLWNIGAGVYDAGVTEHRHHRDHNRRNNNPTNICRVDVSEHHALHEAEKWQTKETRKKHGAKIKEAFSRLREDEDWFNMYANAQRIKATNFHHQPQYAEQREQWRQKVVTANQSEEKRARMADLMRARFLRDEFREEHSRGMKLAWSDGRRDREGQAEIARRINLRDEITSAVVSAALKVAGTLRGAAKYLKCDRSVFRRFPEILSEFYRTKLDNNHKVVSIREVDGVHDVYCLTVPEHGNFALESGVFVKNCGIIVNVTPFEPEWEGYVTLEFSNTTPLPAKIYADEGCAQVLFFAGSQPCDVSYKDRDGKYMGQLNQPVTPKV